MIEDIRKTLWAAADKLRANMDAAEYKHIVLGLIFVKYISDTFQARREELIRRFADPADDYFLHDCDDALLASELEDRDYYKEVNVFWVPEDARWEKLRNAAKQADIGKRIDDALALIETENPRLKGILDKRYARAQLPQGKLGELVDLVSQIGFGADVSVARDILGQVYEYFLGQFASAEGKKGGQFYTPASIVQTLVAVLAPHHGQVYDPCCGSGGMFVQSEKFIESHGGKLGDVSIYGQESNPTTWRLAAMNLAIRGIDFNLGKEPNDTFTRNQHPDLRADFVLANPPFNISDWWHGSLEGDPRWVYGTPPAGNANYAWLQHMLYHLKPGGRAGIVLANGSMSSSQNSEGDIRRAMVEADVVECMVALPSQLFFNTQIPACLWFLRKPPSPSGRGAGGEGNPRSGQVLFIDARKLGTAVSRVQIELDIEAIARIADTFHAWRNGDSVRPEPVEGQNGAKTYADIPGFCRSVPLAEIAEHGHVLTPGRYVGAEEVEDDDEAFADKMLALTEKLGEQMAKGAELDQLIRHKLGGWGMSSEWVETTWGTVASLEYGKSIRDYQNATGEYPVYGTNGPIGWHHTPLCPSAGVIIGRKGAYRGIHYSKKPFFVIDTAFYLKPKVELDTKWTYYCLLTYDINGMDSGSAIPSTSRDEFYQLPVRVPSLDEQRRIAEMLGTLDDRIALLRETNATLEAIAQALFKSWFVDFDPVHARARDEQPEGLPEPLAALFPDSFEESPLGLVPRGWRVEPLSDVMDFKEGPGIRNWQYTNSDEGTRFINIRCIQDGDLTIETANRISDEEANGKYAHFHLASWDVVVSTSGTLGRSAIVREEHLPLMLNTSVIRFRPVVGRTVFSFLYQYLNGVEFLYKLESMASGSVQKNFGPMHLKQIQLVCPPFSVLQAYEGICRPLYEKIVANRAQAQNLATLRDTLLPRLISGQLRLPEAEALAQEA